MDTGDSSSANVAPSSLSASSCLNIWNRILQNPPKATDNFADVKSSKNDLKYFADVKSSKNDLKYFVTKANSGYDSVCRYYLVISLDKDADGNYKDPGTVTNRYKSFSYRPASGQVVSYINND